MVEAHFVTFFSPGTFVAETTTQPIAAWDTETAKRMARDVKERYDATPYGFRFTTRRRDDDELDSQVIATSPMYYLGGVVETLEAVKARADATDRILIDNMECNGWERIITNDNSWRFTAPLLPGDVVLETETSASRHGGPSAR